MHFTTVILALTYCCLAWRQDFVCTLAKLKAFDQQIKEMADGYKQIANELIDAIQNKTLDDFIGFNYEAEIRNREHLEKLWKDNKRLKQLIEMLQTVKKNIGRINTNIFIFKLLKLIYINLALESI